MTDLLAAWWQHPVTITPYAGSGAYGDIYSDPFDATGFVDDSNKLVVNAQGEQVTSSARVFLPATVANVPLDSEVTLPAQFGGRTSRVVSVSRHDAGTQPTPNHIELALL